jgi:hypothetical protein
MKIKNAIIGSMMLIILNLVIYSIISIIIWDPKFILNIQDWHWFFRMLFVIYVYVNWFILIWNIYYETSMKKDRDI